MRRGFRFGLPWAKASQSANITEPIHNLSEWGMHILVNTDADAADAIDIVAVHGLNGHWNNTWRDESTGINWLQHAIPKTLKPACNRAYENDRYRQLLNAIAGVTFFGTPHRGSGVASVGTILGRVLRAASLGTNTNVHILEDLEKGSPLLDNITTTFVDRKYNFPICSFYETDRMDFMSSVVVDRHSAVLGIERETAAPINGNHRSICRFTDGDARLPVVLNNLKHMRRNWSLLLSQQAPPPLYQQSPQRPLLDRLGVSNHLSHKDRNPSPVQGTCSWVLSHSEFHRWHDATGPALMWLSANPGCGKSVMASFLIDHFQSSVVSKNIRLCYWFFKSDNEEQKSAISALRGMLCQLLEARRTTIPTIQEAAKYKSLDTLLDIWKLFLQAVREAPSEEVDNESHARPVRHETICILDGLDECRAEESRGLIFLLETYFQEVGKVDAGDKINTGKLGFMKVLIASRPENWIEAAINRLKFRVPKSSRPQPDYSESAPQYCAIRLKAEDEPGLISADISLVVRAAITDLVNQGYPELLLHDIQEQLISRADRTFIWIVLIIDLLRDKVETGASRRELDAVLKSRTVDDIFTEVLRGRPDAPKTRKLFSILLAATRPLKVEELSIALALAPEHNVLVKSHKPFRPGPQSFKALTYDLTYPFENYIRSLGGHFIRIIRNEVYFVHETAREFLFQENEEGTYHMSGGSTTPRDIPEQCSWKHSLPYQSCHALLLDICASYLYLIGQETLRNHNFPSDDLISFVNYASNAWFIHFVMAIDHIDSLNLPYYRNLCHPRFPGFGRWTEEYWASRAGINPTAVGMVDDEVQDYYIRKLGLGAQYSTSVADEYSDSDDPDGSGKTKDFKTLMDEQEFESKLSANPTAGSNSHFPLEVDNYGFVSLDHGIPRDYPK
ncbi:hypothetical protein O1611_g1487 [Lasiodiplodia mahajangana]|uniref:Uncharacterized protein n=1 Tax=Lasiodiplodia mahajangana TaxID=1108764 RepID=A0ACC2JXS9_9PEZI|nr:hypothetical protein O1611_g1487 [Lasiodiplodia mahajangana]